jgi:tetratricopeptide (TPR) repeat protein
MAIVDLDGESDDDLILDAIYRDVIDGVYHSLKASIDSGEFHIAAGNARTPSLVYIFHTLSALIHGDEESIRRTFLLSPPLSFPSSRYESYIESNLASYQLSIRNAKDALVPIKKAMLSAQGIRGRGGARAFRLYALMNVMQGNMADAIEYLQFAADHAERSKDWEESVIISYYTSVVHFLYGNISKAERLASHAEGESLTCGMISWGAKSRFLKGRILFDQGRYFDAYDVFHSISSTEENQDTLNAWKYRAKLYSGGLLPLDLKNEGDGAVFMIEAAYINREYEKAAELSDQLLANVPDNTFVFIEQVDWQSGFSQVELLMFPQMDLWHRLVSTFRALALSRQKSDASADRALSIMKQITRDEKFIDRDINDAFYYFAHYLVLQHANASEIDLNTAVSIAFKRLQR